jgi:hypothetical protein
MSMNEVEVGDVIGDKAGNRYRVVDRRTSRTGRVEYLLRRVDWAERWIEEEIVKSFSNLLDRGYS